MRQESEGTIPTLDPLPRRVRPIRQLSWGDKPWLVECSHPEELRRTLSSGPRAGQPICGLCKGDDLGRSCMTTALVPKAAIEKQDRQGELF